MSPKQLAPHTLAYWRDFTAARCHRRELKSNAANFID
jgi:hypothetical protein